MKESQHTGNAEQHRATADGWALVERMRHQLEFSTILELRGRIEALEAKDEDDKEAWATRLRRPGRSQGERIASLVKRIEALEAAQPNHPAKPDSSLVERVRQAQGCGNERDACAAIREAAAWLREEGYGFPAGKLEEEAMR